MVDLQNDFCSPEVCVGGPVTNRHNGEVAQRAGVIAARAADLVGLGNMIRAVTCIFR